MKNLFLFILFFTIHSYCNGQNQDSIILRYQDSIALQKEKKRKLAHKIMDEFYQDPKYRDSVLLNPKEDLANSPFFDSVLYCKDFAWTLHQPLKIIDGNKTKYPYIKVFFKNNILRKFEVYITPKLIYEDFTLLSPFENGICWINFRGDFAQADYIEYYYKSKSYTVIKELDVRWDRKKENYQIRNIIYIDITWKKTDSCFVGNTIFFTHKYYDKILFNSKKSFEKIVKTLHWECETQKYNENFHFYRYSPSIGHSCYHKEKDSWYWTHGRQKIAEGVFEPITSSIKVPEPAKLHVDYGDSLIYVFFFFSYASEGSRVSLGYDKPEKGSFEEQQQLKNVLPMYKLIADRKGLKELKTMILQD